MRLSELEGKELVNSRDGERLGVFDMRDVVLNTDTGAIEGIAIPLKGAMAKGSWDRKHCILPWKAIKTIGRDLIIVDLSSV